MSSALTRPDFKADLADLRRRIDALERRLTPRSVTASTDPNSHSHSGTGSDSTVTSGASYEATASGQYSTAAGGAATASALYGVAMGDSAVASGVESTALGANAEATANETVALGSGALATHEASVSIGFGAVTTNTSQVNMARRRVIMGAPNSATADADLVTSQISFYLNQGSNTLVVKAKYSDGTVKTGTVALS